MGGNAPPAPKTYSPMENAQAEEYAAAQEAKRAEAARIAEEQRQAAEDAKARKATQASLSRIYGAGQDYGTRQVGSLGYADTYGILDNFRAALDAAKARVPEMSTDVGSFFNYADLFNTAKTDAQNTQRSKLSGDFANLTKPSWQTNYFADTADDAILEAILADQRASAENTLAAARARGQLSEGAYGYATNSLGNAATGARSTLEDLGLGVLGGYRDDLTGIADQYGDAITNYQLGQNVSMNDFTGQLRSKADALTGRMRGDIYNAVGDTELFDVNSLMAKGGASAGASNSPLKGAFAKLPADQAVKQDDRTTGTVGIF